MLRLLHFLVVPDGRCLVPLLAWFSSGCIDPPPFTCTIDDNCVLDAHQGTCQTSVGFCSFPDTTCGSGQRYGWRAGEDLARTCVPDGAGSSGSSTLAGSESDDAGSDGDIPPGTVPGAVRWTATSGFDGEERGTAIAVGGDFVAVAGTSTVAGESAGVVVVLDPEGATVWERRVPASPGEQNSADAIAVDPDNVVTVVGVREEGPFGARAECWRFDANGDDVKNLPLDTADADRFAGVAAHLDGGFTVSGLVAAQPWLQRRDAEGLIAWTRAFDGDGPAGPLAAADGGSIVALVQGSEPSIQSFTAAGAFAWDLDAAAIAGQPTLAAVTWAGDGSVVAVGNAGGAPWAGRLTPAGDISWTADAAGSSGNVAAVASDFQGEIVLAGDADGSATVWKYSGDGVLLWREEASPGATYVGVATDENGRIGLVGHASGDLWVEFRNP